MLALIGRAMRIAGLFGLILSPAASPLAQMPYTGGPYTLTVFVSQGLGTSSAAGQWSSGNGLDLGHVFVELTNGSKQMYIGYYGDPTDPARGQLRVDADLAASGAWDVKETYAISQQGYNAAHWLIDQWGTDGVTWALNHNCADFAEALAEIAGLNLHPPKTAGVNRPLLWGKYLRAHGGFVNPRKAGVASSTVPSGSPGADSCSNSVYRANLKITKLNKCMQDALACDSRCDPNNYQNGCYVACMHASEACQAAADSCP